MTNEFMIGREQDRFFGHANRDYRRVPLPVHLNDFQSINNDSNSQAW